MQLSLRSFALTSGLIWSGCLLFLGLVNLAVPTYGEQFLTLMSSIYPGFHASRTPGDVLIGTLYGLFDGGFGGLLFAWLYNTLGSCCAKKE